MFRGLPRKLKCSSGRFSRGVRGSSAEDIEKKENIRSRKLKCSSGRLLRGVHGSSAEGIFCATPVAEVTSCTRHSPRLGQGLANFLIEQASLVTGAPSFCGIPRFSLSLSTTLLGPAWALLESSWVPLEGSWTPLGKPLGRS